MKYLKRQPVLVNPVVAPENEYRFSLSGDWRFRLDPENVGIEQRWFDYPYIFQEYIKVPGCWQGQGFGSDELDLHKETCTYIKAYKATYKGTGWYFRSFSLPKDFVEKRLWLNFGGVCATAYVWVNGVLVGENHHPYVPFGFDVTSLINQDGENTVVVRVTDEDLMLSFCYRYSGVWEGLYRDVELLATDAAYIDHLRIYPNERTGEVKVVADLGDTTNGATLNVKISSLDGKEIAKSVIKVEDNKAEKIIKLDDFSGWSPDSPTLYRVDAELYNRGKMSDCTSDRFGFITLSTSKKQFMINDEPYYMRGTGDFSENPKTGSPNTDRDYWRRCLKQLRDYGYNYVRCQSYVPVPEYFDAADEVGLIVQSEMGMLAPIWGFAMQNVYNWPRPTPEYREDIREQWNSTVLRDVNHPSANIYCMSNELKSTYFPKIAWRCYNETKDIKPTSFVIWTDGGHHRSFTGDLPQDFVNDDAEADVLCDLPLIQHEFKWWSSFPDVRQIDKYKGAAMHNWAVEKAIESTIEHKIPHILEDAAINSQALQFIEMKGKLEELRRDNPTLAGVCHFNALDTMGSPQGVVDIFYDKKHATAEQWRQTNGDTVILSDLNFDNRILMPDTDFVTKLSVSDFSHPSFISPKVVWSLEDDTKVVANGEHTYAHKPFCTVSAGEISLKLPKTDKPLALKLKACLVEGERKIDNEWDLYLIPSVSSLSENIYFSKDGERKDAKVIVTSRFTEELVDFARSSGAVIVKAGEGLIRPFDPVQHLSVGRYFFSKPASYPPYEELQSGTIIKDHKIFGDIPHKKYADLLFYNMIGESPALDLEPLGLNDSDPIIRMIHAYQVCRSLGYLVERRVGKGLVIVTSLCIDESFKESLYLLSKIVEYAEGGDWETDLQMSSEAIKALVSGTNLD